MELNNWYRLNEDSETEVGESIRFLLVGDEIIHRNYRMSEIGIWADFYLPRGCKALKFPEKTAVEVKLRISYTNVQRVIQRYLPIIEKNELSKLVIICKGRASLPNLEKYVATKWKENVDVLDYDDFIAEAKKAHRKPDDQHPDRIENTDNVDKARSVFREERCTFFLGAGVSMDAKLPSWSALLEKLLEQNDSKPYQHINKANSDAISEVFGHSSIIAGRYAFDGYRKTVKDTDGQKDEEEIKKIIRERMRTALYQKKDYPSKLVTSIAKAIRKRKPIQVITYNYDDLLERELRKRRIAYSPEYNKDISRRKDVIPIYHVHGMISSDEFESCMPILSEREYHKLYCNLHNWANVVQLHALNSTACFFIGFSMTDPNQRRLLEFTRYEDLNSAMQNELPHYVFLRKTPLKGEASQKVNEEHWKEMENMMTDFGLNVIWFREFSQLPELIDYISGTSNKKPDIK